MNSLQRESCCDCDTLLTGAILPAAARPCLREVLSTQVAVPKDQDFGMAWI